jgi:hypothetical protein
MPRILLMLVFALLLASCGGQGPKSTPSAEGAASGITVGTLHNGAPLVVGQGDAAGKGLVLVYFATW